MCRFRVADRIGLNNNNRFPQDVAFQSHLTIHDSPRVHRSSISFQAYSFMAIVFFFTFLIRSLNINEESVLSIDSGFF